MIVFKMKGATKQTDEQLARWTAKTARSLNGAVNSGVGFESARIEDLRDRFDSLKAEMKGRGTWEDFCDKQGWDHRCNAGDCMA